MDYENEIEKRLLSNPVVFYSISDTNFELINYSKENAILKIDYKPCFKVLEKFYAVNNKNILNFKFFSSRSSSTSSNNHNTNTCNNTCNILIHGFGSKNKKIYYQIAEKFNSYGIDSLIYCLPFHFERFVETVETDYSRIKEDKIKQQKNIQKKFKSSKNVYDVSDFRAVLEIFRQSVIELRIIIRLLKELGYKKVGVFGFSFGGFCASLLCCFEESLDFAIPIASMGDFSSLKAFKQKENKDIKDTKNTINEYFSKKYIHLISPINFYPTLSPERILFFQGVFDNRAPIIEAIKLIKKWKPKKAIFYPCDHFSFFLFNRVTVKISAKFIKSLVKLP